MRFALTRLSVRRERLRLSAAFLAFFLLFLPGASACAQQDGYTKAAQTVLLICTDEEGTALRSAYLAAISEDVAILPLPGATRVQQTHVDDEGNAQQLYAPLEQAFHGPQDAQSVSQSVRVLLSGTPIDRIVVFCASDVVHAANLLGGVYFSTQDLPPIEIYAQAGGIYPDENDNDPMGLLLRSALLRAGLTPGYDVDLGRALRRGGALPESILLSGEQAGAVFEFYDDENEVSVNLPMLHRQQQILLALMHAAAVAPQTREALIEQGGDLGSVIALFCDKPVDDLSGSVIMPEGNLLHTGTQSHWIFDSTWLRNWIFENIYAAAQSEAS